MVLCSRSRIWPSTSPLTPASRCTRCAMPSPSTLASGWPSWASPVPAKSLHGRAGSTAGTGHVVNGSIKLDGEEIAGAKPRSSSTKLRGTKMGLVPQGPDEQPQPGVAYRHRSGST